MIFCLAYLSEPSPARDGRWGGGYQWALQESLAYSLNLVALIWMERLCIEFRTSRASSAQFVGSSRIMHRVSPDVCQSNSTNWSLDQFCRIMENLSLQATNVAQIDEFIAQVKVIFYFWFHSFSWLRINRRGKEKLQFHDEVQSFSLNLCFDDLLRRRWAPCS